ncbi:hypothetical protein HDU91_004226, partial [Kappamyces sp. JEL0680]
GVWYRAAREAGRRAGGNWGTKVFSWTLRGRPGRCGPQCSHIERPSVYRRSLGIATELGQCSFAGPAKGVLCISGPDSGDFIYELSSGPDLCFAVQCKHTRLADKPNFQAGSAGTDADSARSAGKAVCVHSPRHAPPESDAALGDAKHHARQQHDKPGAGESHGPPEPRRGTSCSAGRGRCQPVDWSGWNPSVCHGPNECRCQRNGEHDSPAGHAGPNDGSAWGDAVSQCTVRCHPSTSSDHGIWRAASVLWIWRGR